MFKLLTETERKKVSNEYARRRAIVMLGAISMVLVIGIIGLLPSYLLSNARLEEAKKRMEILARSSISDEETNPIVWLKDINLKLDNLDPKLDKDRPSRVFEKIISERIDGVALTSFTWSIEKKRLTVALSGVATDRQTLIDFRDKVNSTGYFSSVTLPISNLAQDENIAFEMELLPDLKVLSKEPI